MEEEEKEERFQDEHGHDEMGDDSSYNLESSDFMMMAVTAVSTPIGGRRNYDDPFEDEFMLDDDEHQQRIATGLLRRGGRASNSTTPRRRNTTNSNIIRNDDCVDLGGDGVRSGAGVGTGRDSSGTSSRPTSLSSPTIDSSEHSLSVRRYGN
jgi:hypothetical protein